MAQGRLLNYRSAEFKHAPSVCAKPQKAGRNGVINCQLPATNQGQAGAQHLPGDAPVGGVHDGCIIRNNDRWSVTRIDNHGVSGQVNQICTYVGPCSTVIPGQKDVVAGSPSKAFVRYQVVPAPILYSVGSPNSTLSVSRDRVFFNTVEVRGNIWMTSMH
jgi:hypothetical protein